MCAISGSVIGKEVCDALGLPNGVISIDLRIATDEVVIMKVEMQVPLEGMKELTKVLSNYKLTQKD